MGNPINGGNRTLSPPERNNFFYGKLMDVAQWQKDQRYLDLKRALFNRVVLGSGVACGLDLVAAKEGRIVVQPGVAIDGWGREIVVPAAVTIDPHQLTDDSGGPAGDPLQSGVVSVCLAYAESSLDLEPVLVLDCDTHGACAPGTIREGFRMLVRAADDEIPPPPSCGLGEFPLPTEGKLHEELVKRIGTAFSDGPADACVPLGRVKLDGPSIDVGAGRRLIYGNALLFELILCLAERVDALVNP